jgi:alpha-1,2-mannosyltransferase
VHSTVEYGQVNIVLLALVTLVTLDCLRPDPRWPRGALTGLAAAVKLTPAASVLFFLLRRDWRAAATAAGSFAAATGAAFALDRRDSGQYWTHVITATGRPGNPGFAANQALTGLIARAGLDPQARAAMIGWLALSAVVLAVTVPGMRRALAAAEPAWALSLNAFAALLISPISWTHHWVWAEPALLVLAVLAWRHSWRAGPAAVTAGLVTFAVSPAWLLPSGPDPGLRWTPWEQVAGSPYVIFAAAILVLSAFTGYRARPVLVNRDVHVPTPVRGPPGRPHAGAPDVRRAPFKPYARRSLVLRLPMACISGRLVAGFAELRVGLYLGLAGQAGRMPVLAEDEAAVAEGRRTGQDDSQRERLAGQVPGAGPDMLAEQEHAEQAGR